MQAKDAYATARQVLLQNKKNECGGDGMRLENGRDGGSSVRRAMPTLFGLLVPGIEVGLNLRATRGPQKRTQESGEMVQDQLARLT